MTSPQAAITRLLPRYLEIMNRLIMGQREKEIAKDLGITPTRVYQIVNSPLFQLELKRQLRKRYSRISKIEETIIDASEVGAKLFKDTLSNPNISLPIRLEAGNKALTHLFGRILKQMPELTSDKTDNPDELPYEKRLEREIRIKETTFLTPSNSPPHSQPRSQNEQEGRLTPQVDLPPTSNATNTEENIESDVSIDSILAEEDRELEEEFASEGDDNLFPPELDAIVESENVDDEDI